MSRVINPDSAGKERTRLVRAIVVALRELTRQSGPGAESRDICAFISLSLRAVAETIDLSVAPWETRGYWVKADRFRIDWMWTGQYSEKLRSALINDDWEQVASIVAQVAQRFQLVNVPKNNRVGRPLPGSWEKLQ